MNDHLLRLLAFWSAWFISPHGAVRIHAGLRERLLELLDALPSCVHGASQLRKQAGLLGVGETVGVDHPLNQAMFAFMIEHEHQIDDEFQANLENLKRFFSGRHC